MKDLEHPPKKTILTSNELAIVDNISKESPYNSGLNYNNWTGKLLVNWLSLNFNKRISLGTAYNIFSRLNYSKTRAKRLSNKIDKETLTNFREELLNLALTIL